MNLLKVFNQTKKILLSSQKEEAVAQAEAEQILIHCYQKLFNKTLNRIEIYQNSNQIEPPEFLDATQKIAFKRIEGIPLQHLTGKQFFFNHEYYVNSDVLIPRPETELLVEAVIKDFNKRDVTPKLGIEIGIGSGAISIELLGELSELQMLATEVSEKAKDVAKKNAQTILPDPKRVKILMAKNKMEVFEPIMIDNPSQVQADFIVSNPPYITFEDQLPNEVKDHEPHEALFSLEEDPIYFYRVIASEAKKFLTPAGKVFLELPEQRADVILKYFQSQNWNAQLLLDLNHKKRILIASRSI